MDIYLDFMFHVFFIVIKFLLFFSSVQSLSRVQLFVFSWTAARHASLSITNSWSLLKLISLKKAAKIKLKPNKEHTDTLLLTFHTKHTSSRFLSQLDNIYVYKNPARSVMQISVKVSVKHQLSQAFVFCSNNKGPPALSKSLSSYSVVHFFHYKKSPAQSKPTCIC